MRNWIADALNDIYLSWDNLSSATQFDFVVMTWVYGFVIIVCTVELAWLIGWFQ